MLLLVRIMIKYIRLHAENPDQTTFMSHIFDVVLCSFFDMCIYIFMKHDNNKEEIQQLQTQIKSLI